MVHVKCFTVNWDGGPKRGPSNLAARYTTSVVNTNIITDGCHDKTFHSVHLMNVRKRAGADGCW